ncbi:hypothetical protein RJT34_15942 [Clitoria ternatea]|uniref:F-box associated beta-propeller type 1 domain-containing protein n=1 Tax=Clitoria ternatea TaxID=43366 RepID=A0AAN9J7J0_CLITE
MRFKCTSKPWNCLISDPTFAILHFKKSSQNPHLTVVWEQRFRRIIGYGVNATMFYFPVTPFLKNPSLTVATAPSFPLKEQDYASWVVGSINGIICLRSSYFTKADEYSWLSLWNPATRLTSRNVAYFRAARYEEPLIYKYAFGYDNLTRTYKAVVFCEDGETRSREVGIYSFHQKSRWRKIKGFPDYPISTTRIGTNDGVYLNGTINWLSVRHARSLYLDFGINVDEMVINSLDLGSETYKQLLLPSGFDEVPDIYPSVGVLKDCLCFSHDCKGTHFVVWVMKEFGVEVSWTQFLSIGYNDLQVDIKNFSPLVPVFVSKDDDVVVIAKLNETQAMLYYRRDNRVERTEIAEPSLSWNLANYSVESLFLP